MKYNQLATLSLALALASAAHATSQEDVSAQLRATFETVLALHSSTDPSPHNDWIASYEQSLQVDLNHLKK